MTTIVADCKSGKVSDPNRVFWLRGLMDFVDASEGVLVKKSVDNHARFVAPKLGIRVLDENGLDVLEKSLDIDTSLFDIGDPIIYQKMSSLWGIKYDQKPTEKQLVIKGVYQYLQYQYWMLEEYRNIQTLIERFSTIKSELHVKDIKARYLVYVGLQRLTLSVLKMSSAVSLYDIRNIKSQSHAYLFGGAFVQNERERIIKLLNKLIEHHETNEKILLEPYYFDELVEIVNKIILNSSHASKMLQHLDVFIIEYIMGSKKNIEEILGNRYSVDFIVLIKRIATMFQKSAEIEDGFFEELRTI